MKQSILFGTNNPHKLREIREILSPEYQVFSLADLGIDHDVEETEPDLQGNALLKARAFHALASMPCFADDTGLEVEALEGRPGVKTARYAGPQCSPDDNIDKMLEEMAGQSNRKARFRTVIAFVDGETSHTFEGSVLGQILTQRQGAGGFGYDPIFQPDGYQRSFAELTPEEKNAISHRGRAVMKFAEFILKGQPS